MKRRKKRETEEERESKRRMEVSEKSKGENAMRKEEVLKVRKMKEIRKRVMGLR